MIYNCDKCGTELDVTNVTCSPCSKNEAILLKSDDWEILYINGERKEEGHTLNEGKPWIRYFLDLATKYNFDIRELKEVDMNDNDSFNLKENGYSEKYIKDYIYNYVD
jgi:hypothetical protein